MAFTKFKLLAERLLSGLGRSKTFFPFYDSQNDADYRVSLDTLITFISNELGVSSKAVFELTGVSNTGNNYVSTLDITSYKTEGLYIFKPSVDSDDVSTLNVNSIGILDIKEFNGTSIVDKTDLKAVNTYLLLNKTSYWLVVGGVSGGDPPVPDLSGYVTRNGNETISRNEIFTTTSDIAFGINGIISNILYISTSQTQLKITNGSKFAGLFLNTDGNDANTKATLSVDTKSFEIHKTTGGTMYGDIIKYNSDRTTEINANGLSLINRAYADTKYALSGSAGLETFTENLTIVSNAINLNCQNKAFPVFYVTGFGTSPLNITISNDYGVVEATLIISTSSYPNGLITLPFVSYPSTYQPSGETSRIVLKMNWVVGNFIWTITEQPNVDKQNIQQVKSADFSAENNNNYATTGTILVTEPTGVTGKGYSVTIVSGTTTIDSIPYSIAGTKITRLYNGSIWLTKVEVASGGATNLGYTPSPTNGIVTSDTGTDATIPLADGTNAGLSLNDYTSAEKTKLFGIATGANVGVVPNIVITGATKTKITYDNKGLVTAGADATTDDIADSTNKRYQTDTQSANNDATSSIQTQLNAAIKMEIVKNPSVANLAYSGSAVPLVLSSNYFLEYIDNATESARFQDNFPQNYKANGCTVELHWRASTATSGNVVWAADFMRQNSNSSITESFGTQKTATTACSGTLNNKVISSLSFSHAELASLVGGEAFKIRVSRIGANGSDTMAGYALLELVVIKFS